jgi:predicted protein tyrosine phosphatase
MKLIIGMRHYLSASQMGSDAARVKCRRKDRRGWIAGAGNARRPMMINALFLCSANRLRSPTAEQVFSTWKNVETDSAGLNTGANVELSHEQIVWADIIFVMEKAHRNKLSKKFRRSLGGKRIICLDIPDEYAFMAPELIRLLEVKAGKFLG